MLTSWKIARRRRPCAYGMIKQRCTLFREGYLPRGAAIGQLEKKIGTREQLHKYETYLGPKTNQKPGSSKV